MAAKKKKSVEDIIQEEPKQTEIPLAKKIQALDSLFAELTAKTGIIGGRISVPEVRDRMTFQYRPMPIPAWNSAANGIPVGKMVIFSGAPDSGKTNAAMAFIAHNQKLDPNFVALWVESEDSVDLIESEKLHGIDLDRTYFISTTDPKTKKMAFGAEAIGNAIIAAISNTDSHIDVVVINSLKMLVPMTETTKGFEEATMALQASLNARLTKKLIPLCAQRKTTVIVVQHLTTNMNSGLYGNPNMLAGGKAIRYNSMQIYEFTQNRLDDGDPVNKGEGLKFHVTVKKNHCVLDRNPYVDFYYFVEYGKGIEKYITRLKQLIDTGILVSRGAWIYLLDENGEKDPNMSWYGKKAFKEDMINNPTKFDTLCSMIDENVGVHDLSAEEIASIEAENKQDAEIVETEEAEETEKTEEAGEAKCTVNGGMMIV